MIKIIHGAKGTGKTMRMFTLANESASSAKGNCVFIASGKNATYNLKHAIRFIDVTEYGINGPKMFAGFLSGIAAQDFDLEYIFIDGFTKIVNHPLDTLEQFFEYLDVFSKNCNIKLIISISVQDGEFPDYLKKYSITIQP
ncbi:MAG: ATP-binding protein [Clostridia bacterium]|nr:ATP-binding protein [Clostridia bacterium]